MKKSTNKYVLKGNYELNGSHKPFPTCELENGSIIILDNNNPNAGAEAYDKRWLGLFSSAATAEQAAKKGYCASFQQEASELSAWLLWNDATRNTITTVLEDENGSQIIMISDCVYLRTSKDNNGWTVEWLTSEELNEQYNKGDYMTLRYADKPFLIQ